MVERLVNVTRVGKKGVVVIPKAARELAGIREGEFVVMEVEEGRIVIRPLRPLRLGATARAREVLEEALREDLVACRQGHQ